MRMLNLFGADGRPLLLPNMKITGLKLKVSSPAWEYERERVDGMPGEVTVQKTLLPREMTAEMVVETDHYLDSVRVRDALYGVFSLPFYIGENALRGKWWSVEVGEWMPERLNPTTYFIELPLTAPSGLAESIHVHEQSFTSETFIFKNEGNYPIDLRHQEITEITFTGPSTGLQIENKSTGDLWSYNGSTVSGDTLTIQGVRSLKNGSSVFRDTNKRTLTFSPGKNEIEIRGAGEGFELSIRTRFYYL